MTGKGRMIAALGGRSTERPPFQLLMYDGYIAHCAGRKQWEFDYGTPDEQFEMQMTALRRYPDSDGFWTWTGTNRGPVQGVHVEIVDGEPYAVYDDGRRKPLDDNAANGMWNRSPEEMQRINDSFRVHSISEIVDRCGSVVQAEDLLKLPGYQVLSRLSQSVGEERFLWVNHSSLFSSAANYLGGIEEAWTATLTDPELVEAVLEHLTVQHIEYVKAAAISGGHGLWNCFMNEGANVLSPVVWRNMIKPRVSRIVQTAHELGLKHVAWFLDDCRPLVGDLIDIGIDGLATEEPRANYKCEPGDLRTLAGDSNLCIFGWFYEYNLVNGDQQKIRLDLEEQYRTAGSGRPFVVNTPGLTQDYKLSVGDMVIEEARRLFG